MKISLEARSLACALLAALLSLGSALLLANPIAAASRAMAPAEPQFDTAATPEFVEMGRKSFNQTCADCHGADAHGDEGPDLHNLVIPNARIATTIKNGIKGQMPAFGRKYGDHDIAGLVSYLRTLH